MQELLAAYQSTIYALGALSVLMLIQLLVVSRIGVVGLLFIGFTS